MYAALCARLADDLEAGGPTAALLEPHVDLRGPDALALRLLGSVHRLVLERRAGALAAYFPSGGGVWEEEPGWAAFREVLADAALTLDPAWSAHPGEAWPDLVVAERHGCDTHPVDPTTTEGRTALSAYTWPDQPARWERLGAALEFARAVPAEVVAEPGAPHAFLVTLTTSDGGAVAERVLGTAEPHGPPCRWDPVTDGGG